MKRVLKCVLVVASFLLASYALPPPARPADAAAAHAPQPQPDAPALYRKHCATCHGNDGRAKTFKARFNKARDLTDAAWHAEASDERLFNSIANGRGEKMPAFKKKLSTAETEALVRFVRTLRREPRRTIGEKRAL